MNLKRNTPVAGERPGLVDAVEHSGGLAIYAHYLSVTGLDDTLRGSGPFTVFAPTDEAFHKLPQETLEALAADPARMRALLEHHIVNGLSDRTVTSVGKLRTLHGTALTTGVTDDGMTVEHAHTCGKRVVCANGVFHAIDTVLIPGAVPALSAEARAESAWSGRRRRPRPVTSPEDWPFVGSPPRGH